MITKQWLWEMWMKAVADSLGYYPRICAEGDHRPRQESMCVGRTSNRALPHRRHKGSPLSQVRHLVLVLPCMCGHCGFGEYNSWSNHRNCMKFGMDSTPLERERERERERREREKRERALQFLKTKHFNLFNSSFLVYVQREIPRGWSEEDRNISEH